MELSRAELELTYGDAMAAFERAMARGDQEEARLCEQEAMALGLAVVAVDGRPRSRRHNRARFVVVDADPGDPPGTVRYRVEV